MAPVALAFRMYGWGGEDVQVRQYWTQPQCSAVVSDKFPLMENLDIMRVRGCSGMGGGLFGWVCGFSSLCDHATKNNWKPSKKLSSLLEKKMGKYGLTDNRHLYLLCHINHFVLYCICLVQS